MTLWNKTKSYAEGVSTTLRNPSILPLAVLIWMHHRYFGQNSESER